MIDYFKHVDTPAGTYSIDYFTFEFLLLCTSEMIEKMIKPTIERLQSSCPGFQHFTSNKFGYPKEIYQFPHIHIEISENHIFKWDSDNDIKKRGTFKLSLSFNPNKVGDASVIRNLFFTLNLFIGLCDIRIRRTDFTFDIPHPIDDVYILSRKTESNWKSTRYYGVRENSGYLRVYDKREEIKQKEKYDIGEDITRLEWEMRNEKEFQFDSFCIPDFSGLDGTARFLMEVPPERIQHALRRVAPATASKIRKKCFKPYDFNPEHFKSLYEDYMNLYGISALKFKCEQARAEIEAENAQFTWDIEDIPNDDEEVESLHE